jgi:ubiquinone/menaquinone biosynthesis C-methylase UbiE
MTKMGGHKWHYYDETERRTWQNPEEILRHTGLQAGQTLVDIGCGEGFFTLPAARLAGPDGLVYGIDSNPEAMDLLKQKAAVEGLQNIRLTVKEAEEALICEGCADLTFLGLVLHDFRDAVQVLQNARKMLKPGGHLINLDWQKAPMEMGPPLEKRFDNATASGLLQKAGFTIQTSQNWGQYTYLIIAAR